jgi:hypothetical protein
MKEMKRETSEQLISSALGGKDLAPFPFISFELKRRLPRFHRAYPSTFLHKSYAKNRVQSYIDSYEFQGNEFFFSCLTKKRNKRSQGLNFCLVSQMVFLRLFSASNAKHLNCLLNGEIWNDLSELSQILAPFSAAFKSPKIRADKFWFKICFQV